MPSDNSGNQETATLNIDQGQPAAAENIDQGQPAAAESSPILDRIARLENTINSVAGSPILRLIGVPADAAGDIEAVEAQINKVAPIIAELVAFADRLHASGSGHSLGSLLSLIGSQFVAEL